MNPELPQVLGLVAGVAVLAFVYAKVEIMIEGGAGWAANLPCWRIEKHRLLDWFFGGRPMTGYHAWVLPFMVGVFHLHFAFAWSWSWRLELRTLAAVLLFWIIEDVLWFILNPAWGLRRLRRGEVPWHINWFLGAPTDYWTFTTTALVLLWLSLP
jgi:hypothetical protein